MDTITLELQTVLELAGDALARYADLQRRHPSQMHPNARDHIRQLERLSTDIGCHLRRTDNTERVPVGQDRFLD